MGDAPEPTTLVWLDLETTGLNEHADQILEVAVATASFMRPFEHRHVYHATVALGEHVWLDEYVRTMHTTNGLLEDCKARGKRIARVAEELFDAIPGEEGLILAGSSVHFDARFLQRYAPDVFKRFSHRYYDVSAVKLFARSLGMPKLPRAEAHRAKADIDESVMHARLCAEWFRGLRG